ncbi:MULTISPECIES: sulfite exporter TauE/SafE family protein [Nguyenibacter]|uniref:Probable membrane transporter protein n=1 Tax=Nguyenibacter vanlangensis TaxID=1216886 RepID=A0ABZ3D494_9PROT|nr:sulfite exporter TauE/SafE family protein [Nguyenibacter sp. L1]WRH87251.1 sulfite exporter TauE/SafE family protein [Nguyenibacter sp. L1]
MTLSDAFQPLYSLSGLGVGFLVGVTGVGGGSLMTPLLILLFGIHPQTAVGTDLLYAAITKAVGTSVHGSAGGVDWKIVRRLSSGSIPAAALTLLALHALGAPSLSTTHLISRSLGVALLLTAPCIMFRAAIMTRLAGFSERLTDRQAHVLTILVGALLGLLVSLSSVGAGAIGVTALLVLYPRLSTARIVGSDIAHAVPLTLVAGLGHWLLGSVDPAMLIALLTGSIPGIILGSLFVGRIRESVQRTVLATVLLIVGARLI